ncbi:MiaB/RimO family radical SAM methylthiotransferase [Treponema lecithinolyticum]|uniref:Ribosomal protein S12 methylthiotransferase RimO n=1 Tax=Treponema lecithinolyticum ATCC 700332 TaxID=1321815 RepID=A0ABN0NYZ6_TRELE|nr:MiaB/RimO family radical SAM methylthiotransferase [Treponema lecithinolyticum]ERJ93138.1 putative ribosomal protein S12 methylthiotransferase RimO [Treponema lecithinolyticum ATCC 700332]
MHGCAKRFFLDEHGCAKNQVDAELIINRLKKKGWQQTESPENAQLIVVNSCGFIESAKKESLDAVLTARRAYPDAKILLAGCLSQRYAGVFKTELPEADGIFGNGDLSLLDDVVVDIENGKRPVVTAEQKGVCIGERNTLLSFPASVYVKITEGCNNRCSFCAIPLIRGVLRSRSADDIVSEIKTLYDRGIFEFNLIGQDLAAYGCDDAPAGNSAAAEYAKSPSPLSLLLKKISELEGAFWLRLLYIHPDHFPRDILPVLQNDKRILPYFDIPFQSGSTAVLNAMNRSGNAEKYVHLVQDIRKALPDAVLRTTFLCGFPGETDEDAQHTLNFLKTVQPHWSGCFAYSREEDTPAASLKKSIPDKTVQERIRKLQKAQQKITEELLESYIGRTYEVLVEEVVGVQLVSDKKNDDSKKSAGMLTGSAKALEGKAFDGKKAPDFPNATEDQDSAFALARCPFQAPEVDGSCVILLDASNERETNAVFPGARVIVTVVGVRGVDVVGRLCL